MKMEEQGPQIISLLHKTIKTPGKKKFRINFSTPQINQRLAEKQDHLFKKNNRKTVYNI